MGEICYSEDRGLPFVNPGPFVNSNNEKNTRFKRIEDAVSTDPYPENTLPAEELLCTPGPGVLSKTLDPCCQPVSKRLFCSHEELFGLRPIRISSGTTRLHDFGKGFGLLVPERFVRFVQDLFFILGEDHVPGDHILLDGVQIRTDQFQFFENFAFHKGTSIDMYSCPGIYAFSDGEFIVPGSPGLRTVQDIPVLQA